MAASSQPSADANLLLAYVVSDDALHHRARTHMAKLGRLRASVPAVLEAMTVIHRKRLSQQAFVTSLREVFDADEVETLETAARTLDEGLLRTPFDAYHAADAFLRGAPLHTADEELLHSPFPTAPF